MANHDHLMVLSKGVAYWNEWRRKNPTITPDFKEFDFWNRDLTGVNFNGADLRGTNLKYTNFTDADLRNACFEKAIINTTNFLHANLENSILSKAVYEGNMDLKEANLSRSDLSGVEFGTTNLDFADFRNANLTGVTIFDDTVTGTDFSNSNLSHAYIALTTLVDVDCSNTNLFNAKIYETIFRNVSLINADLRGTDLSDSDLVEVDIQGADLRKAIIKNTRFSSKEQLNSIKYSLTHEQLMGCRFKDEQNGAEELVEENAPGVVIRFSRKGWRPVDMALALFSLELAANRLQALCAKDKTEDELREAMATPCYPRTRSQGIQIGSAHASELEVFLAFLTKHNIVEAGVVMSLLTILFKGGCKFAQARKDWHEGTLARIKVEEKKKEQRMVCAEQSESPLPPDYQEYLLSKKELWDGVNKPVKTLSKQNGLPESVNGALLEKGLSDPLGYLRKQFLDGFEVTVQVRGFDPNTYLEPEDRMIGFDSDKEESEN